MPRKITGGVAFLVLAALLACKSGNEGLGSPTHVCAWLDGVGMRRAPWLQEVGGEWGCQRIRALPDASVMRFHATGTATVVKEAHVVWSEETAARSSVALDRFLAACDALIRKATDMPMATAPKSAIQTRESGRWEQNGVDVSVEVDLMAAREWGRAVRCRVRIK